MKNNLEIAAYLALIVLAILSDEGELTSEEIKTTRELAEKMIPTDLYKYEVDVDAAGLCFGIITDYIKEQGV